MILTTIPPRHELPEQSAEFAKIARKISADLKLPQIDYHAKIPKRRPKDSNAGWELN